MVVRPPPSDTLRCPSTHIAVLNRLRVRMRRREDRGGLGGHRCQESVSRRSVVRHEIVDSETLDCSGASTERDVHPLRPDALDGLEQVDVRADLEDGAGLYMTCQLRVGDLVVVRPEPRRPGWIVDPKEEVRVAAPGSVEECRLVDDIRPAGHCRLRLGGRRAKLLAPILDRTVELDRDRGPAFRFQICQEAALVLKPPLSDDVELRIVPHRALDKAGQRRALELRQVLAGKVGDQIRGRVDRAAVDCLHEPTLPAVCVSSPVTNDGYDVLDMADKRPDSRNPWLLPSREKLIDRQIREAQEAGAFDDLPFQGERLPLVDDSAAGDWALAYRMLKGSNFAPPWIETDKEVRSLLAERDSLVTRARRSSVIGRRRNEAELRRIVKTANDAIFRLNHQAPTLRQHRLPLDLEAELAALARAHEDRG